MRETFVVVTVMMLRLCSEFGKVVAEMAPRRWITLVFLSCLLPVCLSATPLLEVAQTEVVLANQYTRIVFSLTRPAVSSLQGDFEGKGNFSGPNVVAGGGGIWLQVVDSGGHFRNSSALVASPLQPHILHNDTSYVSVQIDGVDVLDGSGSPLVSSSWVLSLGHNDRQATFDVTVQWMATGASIFSVGPAFLFSLRSGYAMFDGEGVSQMMNSQEPFWQARSTSCLSRFFVVGGGSIDMLFPDCTSVIGDDPAVVPPVLISNWVEMGTVSGMLLPMAGADLPEPDVWTNSSTWLSHATPITPTAGQVWKTSPLSLAPGQHDFPVSVCEVEEAWRSLTSPDTPVMPFDDVRGLVMGPYTSTTGAIVSYTFAPEGRIAPCVATPTRCYAGMYNFFDPDSFLSISALTYMDDAFIQNEVRKLLETTAKWICTSDKPGSNCTLGQMPHHFMNPSFCTDPNAHCNCAGSDCVTFFAISGATQTGPNVFWILSALKYVQQTGNYEWLSQNIDTIRAAMRFLITFFDPSVGMFKAPGPLWVDTFKRWNYASDTNGMLVHLLRQMSATETFLDNAPQAQLYASMASNVSKAMNDHLWDSDHFITQMNPNGSTRDFVDYDSNSFTVAFSIANVTRAKEVLKRMDSGNCTHARATYVSEIFYNASNCNSNNTGDSAVTMGRIGWADALGRRRMALATGDETYTHMFEEVMLAPLQADLLQNTWMYERFTCQGKPTHNPFYIEYPEVVTMMLREVKYGIDFGFNSVSVFPMPGSSMQVNGFVHAIGNTLVEYSSSSVTLRVPVVGASTGISVGMLPPGAVFQCTSTAVHMADVPLTSTHEQVSSDGVLQFTAKTGPDVVVQCRVQQ